MTRTDLLNHLIHRHGLNSYLEIGVQNPSQNFDKIQCKYRVGVDPDDNAHASFCMTSNEFFAMAQTQKYTHFDIIFIDGLHIAEQVKTDFENALSILSKNGFIVLHDCNPIKEEHTIVPRPTRKGHWNGDVWKFAVNISNDYSYTVDIDNGCRVFDSSMAKNDRVVSGKSYSWEYFDKNRKELLNLISWDEFIKL